MISYEFGLVIGYLPDIPSQITLNMLAKHRSKIMKIEEKETDFICNDRVMFTYNMAANPSRKAPMNPVA